MKMIVGLGNPGAKYEFTRHNVGFMVLDRLSERLKAPPAFVKNEGLVCEAQHQGEKLLLVKPQTYMNLSGRTVAPLFKFYKLSPDDLIVIHDDLDLEPFSLRIKTGGGSGGHNGIKSIDEHLGKDLCNYHRVRIGIGKGHGDAAKHVLQNFEKADYESLDQVLEESLLAVEMIIQGKVIEAMNRFNRKQKGAE